MLFEMNISPKRVSQNYKGILLYSRYELLIFQKKLCLSLFRFPFSLSP